MSAVQITVYQITNQSLALVAAQEAVELLPLQCASLVPCVRPNSDSYSFHIIPRA